MNQTTSDTVIGITQIIVLLVPVVAGCFLLAGYLLNQIWARNERRAKAFAEALAAVEDYLEMPYRVRRRPASDPEVRSTLTNQMSDIKARIAFHQAWLQVEAPQVAEAYDDLVQLRVSSWHMMACWPSDEEPSHADHPAAGDHRRGARRTPTPGPRPHRPAAHS